jgi:hypothetical protein
MVPNLWSAAHNQVVRDKILRTCYYDKTIQSNDTFSINTDAEPDASEARSGRRVRCYVKTALVSCIGGQYLGAERTTHNARSAADSQVLPTQQQQFSVLAKRHFYSGDNFVCRLGSVILSEVSRDYFVVATQFIYKNEAATHSVNTSPTKSALQLSHLQFNLRP